MTDTAKAKVQSIAVDSTPMGAGDKMAGARCNCVHFQGEGEVDDKCCQLEILPNPSAILIWRWNLKLTIFFFDVWKNEKKTLNLKLVMIELKELAQKIHPERESNPNLQISCLSEWQIEEKLSINKFRKKNIFCSSSLQCFELVEDKRPVATQSWDYWSLSAFCRTVLYMSHFWEDISGWKSEWRLALSQSTFQWFRLLGWGSVLQQKFCLLRLTRSE